MMSLRPGIAPAALRSRKVCGELAAWRLPRGPVEEHVAVASSVEEELLGVACVSVLGLTA